MVVTTIVEVQVGQVGATAVTMAVISTPAVIIMATASLLPQTVDTTTEATTDQVSLGCYILFESFDSVSKCMAKHQRSIWRVCLALNFHMKIWSYLGSDIHIMNPIGP